MMLKRLLNRAEENTFRILQGACIVDDACVHAKIGLREIFNFLDSSLTPELRDYCFTAHFDFLITDAQFSPLFAVEFDGPMHHSQKQKLRDAKKNALCKIFGLPLLRINSRYLHPTYRGMDLLAWFTECFFVNRAFNEAQAAGMISSEEGFTHQFIYSIGDGGRHWPLWLSHDIREHLRKLHKSGKCHDWIPSYVVGRDQEQTCQAMAVIAVTDQSGVFARTAMKAQQFPIAEEEAVEELVVFEVFESLQKVLSGLQKPLPLYEIDGKIHAFDKKVRITGLSSIGARIPPLRNNRGITTMFLGSGQHLV
jgi:hypothetical protein